MLSELPFYPYLSKDEKALLSEGVRIQSFKKGDLIHSHGDECLGLFTVSVGTVSVSVLSDEGKEVSLFLLRKGDSCVLSAACIMQNFDSDAHFVAETDATLTILPAAHLHRVMHENLRVECEVHKMANRVFGRVMQSMQKMLFFSIGARVADYLLLEVERTGDSTVRLTHEQLAKYIGSAREVVTNTLRRMAKEGALALRYGTVTVLSESALRKELKKTT